jgi:large subunit ribosomal protein L6
MSRVGKKPIVLPSGVTVDLTKAVIKVSGSLGQLSENLTDDVIVTIEGNLINVAPKNNSQKSRAMWGTTRNKINNMVEGVSSGYTRRMETIGVGFRCAVDQVKFLDNKSVLTMFLGFSHEIKYLIPEGVTIVCEKPTLIVISGRDKQLVGKVCADIRKFRKPEPYKGKGNKFVGEQIRRKEGKKK